MGKEIWSMCKRCRRRFTRSEDGPCYNQVYALGGDET